MKERPILFSAPMVRALLAGTKTQTRRVMKQATGLSLSVGMADEVHGIAELSWLYGDGPGYDVEETIRKVACPYGQPGDRLWVRETWSPDPPADGTWAYAAWAGCKDGQIAGVPERFRHPRFCNYAADWLHDPIRWTPSIHMPRWASRITLEVTGVRVERLRDIGEADAVAEGLTFSSQARRSAGCIGIYECQMPDGKTHFNDNACDLYRTLWEQINGPGSWAVNPWVWAVEFRRLP